MQNPHRFPCGEQRRRRKARLRRRRDCGAWPGFEATRRATRQHTRPHRWEGRRRTRLRYPRPAAAPIGGIALHEGSTRRRHAASRLRVVQNPHRFPCGEQRRRRRAWLRCPWAAAGPGRTTSRRAEPHVSTPGPTGVEGAGGTGGHGRVSRRGAWPRCRWAVAGPGRASRSTTPSRRLACGDLAGGPPPTGTHSGPDHQGKPRGARNTRGATSNKQRTQKRPPGTGWAYLSRLWESNPRPIHYE